MWQQRPESGALEVRFESDSTITGMTELSLRIALTLDERRFSALEALDEEESGAPRDVNRLVTKELWGSIDEVRSVGPGGRITIYESQRRADIVVRHRVRRLGGIWRPPNLVEEAVNDLFGEGFAPDVTLRGALGYFEASKFDQQRYLRPAFVFLLDQRPAGEGPRWRVATVTAATTADNLSVTAGLETVVGGRP
jgi:hypothetical protein